MLTRNLHGLITFKVRLASDTNGCQADKSNDLSLGGCLERECGPVFQ